MNTNSEYRPKLNIPLTKTDYTIEGIALMGIIMSWVLPSILYAQLPEIIVTHFGIGGKPDGWGSKKSIFILPAILTILYIGLTILNRFPHVFNYPVKITSKNALQQYTKSTRIIRVLKLGIVAIFLFIEWQVCKVSSDSVLPKWFVPVLLIVPVILPVVMAFSLTSGKNSVKK